MSKVIYIDVETTGLIKYVHGLLQVAYIIEIDGDVKKRGSFRINPNTYKKKIKVSPQALEVNGITEADFDKYKDSKEACAEFVAVLNKYIDRWDKADKFRVVGYNSSFDVGFIQEWFTDSGYDSYGQYFDYKDLDVFALVKYLVHFGLLDTGKSQNLESACKAIDLEFDGHDAVADIEATRDLHIHLVERFLNDKTV